MADVSKINVNGTDYNIKDATARTAAAAAQTTANSKLSDAPSDGKQYARQDGAWAEVSGGGGSSETQPWPITSLDDDTIQKWATIPNGTYWYNNNGYFNSPEELGHGFLEHKVDADSFNVTQTFYGQADQPTYRRSGNILGDFSYWFRFDGTELNTWYLPKGIRESNVIAAYQFVGQQNETAALVNINKGVEYPLGKSGATWSNTNGFFIPGSSNVGLNNSTLVNNYSNILSAAFGYSGSAADGKLTAGIRLNSSRCLEIKVLVGDATTYNQPGISNGTGYRGGSHSTSGVLSCNWDAPTLYKNGTIVSLTGGGIFSRGPTRVFGSIDTSWPYSSCYITALVLYNITLTSEQHLQLYKSIRSLGGGIS